jgi:hypothetical protein
VKAHEELEKEVHCWWRVGFSCHVGGMALLYHFTFPPDPITFPVEILKTEHVGNGTVTVTYKWLGENDETERGVTPNEKGYGHHILVFVFSTTTKGWSCQYLFVHKGDVLEATVPDRGGFIEMHDGSHIAIWLHADGSKELAYNETGYTK